MPDLERENRLLKAQLEKQTQRASLLTAGLFFSSFTRVSTLVYMFFHLFGDQGMFEVELVCAALATGITLLLTGLLQKLMFGDAMAEFPGEEMPRIEKKKDNLLILITVLAVYGIQIVGYFVLYKWLR